MVVPGHLAFPADRGQNEQEVIGATGKSCAVIAWFPRPHVQMIAAGPTEPCSSEDRCWADEPSGQQCATVIDIDDLLGLCERHRALLQDESWPTVPPAPEDAPARWAG